MLRCTIGLLFLLSSCTDSSQLPPPPAPDLALAVDAGAPDLAPSCGCGGSCPPCPDGAACTMDSDCQSGQCVSGLCVPAPSCSDGIRNQGETDVDCGGPCLPCAVGQQCAIGNDCTTRHCKSGRCITPTPVMPSFAPPVFTAVLGEPPVLADVNGDHKLDLTLLAGQGQFAFLRGNGDGTFAAPKLIADSGVFTAAADLDGDGLADLVGVRGSQLVVRRGTPQGPGNPAVFPGPSNAMFQQGFAFGDVDGNGLLDVVAFGGNLVFPQGPAGVFTVGPDFMANVVGPGAAGDLDGDGKADVIAADNGGGLLAYRGAAHATFLPFLSKTPYLPGQIGPYGLGVGHFNNDGALDAAVPFYDTLNFDCFLGNGKGDFKAPVAVGSFPGRNPLWVVAADFDGDGWDDVAVAEHGPPKGAISIFIRRGDCTFAPQIDIPFGDNIWGLAVGDLNGDGRPDLVTTQYGTGYAVILNTTH